MALPPLQPVPQAPNWPSASSTWTEEDGALHPDWLLPDWAAPHARAFMTTRAGGQSSGMYDSCNVGTYVQDDPAVVALNRQRVAAAAGGSPIFLQQVHGAEVLHLSTAHLSGGAALRADAAISTDPRLACAIQVADCLPVLFAAPGAVGAAHAGWRGLAAGVLERTAAALCAASGCAESALQVWLGPCIGPAAFEVGADVLQALGLPVVRHDQPLCRFQVNEQGQDRWRLDLAGLARLRLQAVGVKHISGGHWCTYSQPSRFFSFRRSPPSGRMAAVVRLLGSQG
ncbi:peptidoglycan editing factor PgeF [Roseateles sp. BYS180W]|uniref:Purine nucleoside phosphorylase n=1 Tax=Roseateles rivi TaxID=3299028 RepID=A0ABW7FYE8_9BURK